MIEKMKKWCKNCNKCYDYGILVLRLAVGYLMLINHGWDKLMGGPERWEGVGEFGMQHLGITFCYTFWGFMAAFSESICAILIGIGFGTRYAASLLMITMLVAANMHVTTGKGDPETALLYAFVSLALVLIGSGKFSIDHQICNLKK